MLQKPAWPGIATLVGITLIVVLAAVGWRDDFHLKDWQTFMSAILALAGGTMAYKGAMAKVYFDRDKERRELNRQKIGILLRLRFASGKLGRRAEDVHKALSRQGSKRTVMSYAIRLDEPPEIEEAWHQMALLPIEAGIQLDVIRTEMPLMKRALDTFAPDDPIQIGFLGVSYGDPLYPYSESCRTVHFCCEKLTRLLNEEITLSRSDA